MMSKEAEGHSGITSRAAASGARCVLLCPPAATGGPMAVPPDLQESLRRKGLVIEPCSDRFEAMARLVVHEREIAKGGNREPILLLVLEPSRVSGVDEVVVAAAKYAPHAACWRYTANATPKMSVFSLPSPTATPALPATGAGRAPTVRMHGAPASGGPAVSGGSGGMSGGFVTWVGPSRAPVGPNRAIRPAAKLRLTGEGPDVPKPATPEPVVLKAAPAKQEMPARSGSGVSLTDEELGMLLGGAATDSLAQGENGGPLEIPRNNESKVASAPTLQPRTP